MRVDVNTMALICLLMHRIIYLLFIQLFPTSQTQTQWSYIIIHCLMFQYVVILSVHEDIWAFPPILRRRIAQCPGICGEDCLASPSPITSAQLPLFTRTLSILPMFTLKMHSSSQMVWTLRYLIPSYVSLVTSYWLPHILTIVFHQTQTWCTTFLPSLGEGK